MFRADRAARLLLPLGIPTPIRARVQMSSDTLLSVVMATFATVELALLFYCVLKYLASIRFETRPGCKANPSSPKEATKVDAATQTGNGYSTGEPGRHAGSETVVELEHRLIDDLLDVSKVDSECGTGSHTPTSVMEREVAVNPALRRARTASARFSRETMSFWLPPDRSLDPDDSPRAVQLQSDGQPGCLPGQLRVRRPSHASQPGSPRLKPPPGFPPVCWM